ncbi:MAG TPA: hypothetical protein VIS76_11790, partial [Pseudomonadales bacterium]
MAEQNQTDHTPKEQMGRSNRELWKEWAIDVTADPYGIPLEALNPAHPSLFEADAIWPYFERLRDESPVQKCENS